MKNNLFFLLIILSFVACDGIEEELPRTVKEVKGQVINDYTKKPLDNLKIYLVFEQKKLDSAFTDKDGRFYFNVLSLQEWDYQIEIAPNNKYIKEPEYPKPINNFRIILAYPLSFVRLDVKNKTPFDSEDKMKLDFFYGRFYKTFGGTKIDTSIFVIIPYEYQRFRDSVSIDCWATKNNSSKYTQKKFLLKPIDTIEVKIDY